MPYWISSNSGPTESLETEVKTDVILCILTL